MLGHRELVLDDYVDILRRRRWILLLPIIIIPALATVTMMLVPKRYVSQTLVLIEQKSVPDDYVKPVVSQDISSRLSSLREQIMSRTRLQPIIERFQLYSDKSAMSEKLDLMRKAIVVQPIKSDIARGSLLLPGFYISFSAEQPHTAQQVCGEITSLFLRENLRAREQAVEGTTQFIRGQLDEAKRNLDEQDAKLAAFQRAHFGEMPEQSQSNVSVMTALGSQMDALTQSLNQLEQNRMYLESMISQNGQDTNQSNSGPTASAMQQELQKAQQNVEDLQSRYTPNHPDVTAAKREVETLKAKIAEADKAAEAPKAAPSTKIAAKDSPQMAQMKAQLQGVIQALDDKKKEQERVRERLAQAQARVQSSPSVQEQEKQLTRDYQSALQFYNDLLGKKEHSEMAGDLEKRQQGEQFRVMDPPNLPDKPAFPDPKVFLGGGFALAIVLSIAMVAWLEYRDRSLRSERDVFAFTQLPTLGTIPLSAEASEGEEGRSGLLSRRKRKDYAGVSE
ncbi:MAG: hypothetical protein NVS9B15_01430 [Acidobacteriaceae bacterium]